MYQCRRANYWFGVSVLIFDGVGYSMVLGYIRFIERSMDKRMEIKT